MAEDIEFPLNRVPKMGPNERARYVPNHRSFGAFMRSPQMRDVTAEAAKDIAVRAAELVPPSPGGKNSRGLHKRVKAGFKVKRGGGLLRIGGNLRVRVLVENNQEGAALLEFGGKGLKPVRMLGRAGGEVGEWHAWREED